MSGDAMTGTTGEQIRAAREARGLTQAAFAAALGLSDNTVRKIERDQHVAPPTLKAALDFLGLGDGSPDLAARVARLEQRLDVAIAAIHLLTVSAAPTSKWLDAKLAALDES